MGKLILIALFLATFLLPAQVLIPTPETAFEPQHHFNPDLIRKKGIKRITFDILDKKDFEVAVDKNLVENYEFNGEGLLTRYYYTTIARTIERQVTVQTRRGRPVTHVEQAFEYDTVSTTFFYSGKNLVLKRFHDGRGHYESRYYRYDKDGNLTKELRFKETNNSADKSVFVLGSQLQLSEDSFQYQKFKSGQMKCVSLNNENRSYKERISNTDSAGRKINEAEYFTAAAWIQQESRYEYRGNCLVSARFAGNAGSEVVLRNDYEYDARMELYTEKQYKNTVLLKEISYVSDSNSGLLGSIVVRDPVNKTIRIIKLRYDFGMLGKSGN